jgi:DNA-binding NarL/FixJ family response regulator
MLLDKHAVPLTPSLGDLGGLLMKNDNFSLTPRECQILELVAKGLTNKEIARRLAISPKTVDAHLQKIYRKMHVSNRAEAVTAFWGTLRKNPD